MKSATKIILLLIALGAILVLFGPSDSILRSISSNGGEHSAISVSETQISSSNYEHLEREMYRAYLDALLSLEKETYQYSKAAYDDYFNSDLNMLSSISSFISAPNQTMLAVKNMMKPVIFNYWDLADNLLSCQYEIQTEPLAGSMTIKEVVRDRYLLVCEYKPHEGEFDEAGGEWLFNESILSIGEKDAKELQKWAQETGTINTALHSRLFAFTSEERNQILTDFRIFLRNAYTLSTNPTLTLEQFEVWACCYILYGKDFDFKTITKIMTDKTIVGNVELKPDTGSPIIL